MRTVGSKLKLQREGVFLQAKKEVAANFLKAKVKRRTAFTVL